MDQIKEYFSLLVKGHSIRKVAALTNSSRNTVKQYLRVIGQAGKTLEEALELSDEELGNLLYGCKDDERKRLFEEQIDYWKDELKRTGVTRHLLWKEYKREHPEGYGYSQFCVHFAQCLKRENGTAVLTHKPGEYLQLDFTGKKMKWFDRLQNRWVACEILVAVLPFSSYTFAYALKGQSQEDLVEGINACLRYFGGVTKFLLSDNMKAFVQKSDRYAPKFNDLAKQLAIHYQTELDATRPYKPKDKAMVEGAVKITYNKVFAPLRDTVFHSRQALNNAMQEQLEILNNTPFQKRDYCRKELFEKKEKQHLRQLPTDVFHIQKKIFAKAQKNCHILLGEDSNYYSIPHNLIGKKLTVLYDSKWIEIYDKGLKVANHKRSGKKIGYITNADHLPNRLQKYSESLAWDADYFLKQASEIGPATKWAIQEILKSKNFVEQTYKACMGVLSFSKKMSPERLENCCVKCQQLGVANYGIIKNMFHNGMDIIPKEEIKFNSQDHENIRGGDHYQ